MEVFENEPFELPADDVAELRRRLGGFVERRPEGWEVTRLVGQVGLPSGTLLRVRSPKAPAASVLAWVAYVGPTLSTLRASGRRGAPVHDTGDMPLDVGGRSVAEWREAGRAFAARLAGSEPRRSRGNVG